MSWRSSWGFATLASAAVALSLASGPTSTATVAPEGAPTQSKQQPVRWTDALSGQAPCPEGRSRSATLLTEGFGKGVPHNSFNNGWTTVAGAVDGRATRSVVNSSDSEDWFFTDWATSEVGTQTMLAFASRGNVSTSSYSRVDVNSVSLHAAANTSNWHGNVFDVTSATHDEGGQLGTWFQHRSRAGASQWWEVDNVQLYTCHSAAVSRIEGTERYSTSAAVAASYPTPQEVVYLASGASFADALSGAALAAKVDAPVLLVKPGSIPTSVRAQLDRLEPGRIAILGGTDAVNSTVGDVAQSYTGGSVTRLAGADRYETAAAIAKTYPTEMSTVYIASGVDYPDALSGSALAGSNGLPLLLTNPDHLPNATVAALDRIAPGRIVILGGSTAVSDAVENQLRDHTDGDVTRIAGDNRYETSALIARTFPRAPDRVFLATGTSFPDALSGSTLAGSESTAVVLSKPTSLPRSARSAIDWLEADSGVVLGGYAAIQSIVLDQLGRLVG